MSMRARTGKIARLPQTIREELNRHLQDGVPGKALVAWLNSLEEVQDVLRTYFGCQSISEKNVSNWRQGGYLDWQLRQDALGSLQNVDTEATDAEESSERPVIEVLLKALVLRYALALRNLNRPNAKGEWDLQRLHKLCRDLIALRRSDLDAQRLQIDQDRLELKCDKERNRRNDRLMQWAMCHSEERFTREQADRVVSLVAARQSDVDLTENAA